VKKILITVMVLVVCVGMIGSAFAYFSDTETSTGNTFTAGTLDLVLQDADEAWDDGVTATWVSPAGWKPGQEVTATLKMKNIGSIGSSFVYLKPTDIVEDDYLTCEAEPGTGVYNLADWINITNFTMTFKDSSGNVMYAYGNWAPGWMTTCGAWGTTAPLTVAEFNNGPWWVVVWGRPPGGGYPESDYVFEASGASIIELEMTFKFEPTAPNDYQGDRCVMTFEVATGNEYPLELHEIWHGSGGYGYVSQ
jgi:spore coat-associated protein N